MDAVESHPGHLRFVFVCGVVLLLGCALRLHPWQQPQPVQAVQAAAVQAGPPAPPEQIVPPGVLKVLTGFYERLDRGRYPEL